MILAPSSHGSGAPTSGLHRRVSSFLRPSTSSSRGTPTPTIKKSKEIRNLCNRFLGFLNSLIKIHAKERSESPKAAAEREEKAEELFSIYRLYLDYMRCITPALILKPYSDLLWRIGFVRRLCEWGRYGEAEEEGLGVLHELRLGTQGSSEERKKGKKSWGSAAGAVGGL